MSKRLYSNESSARSAKRNFLTFVLALAFCLNLSASTPCDVNGDGTVNVQDVQREVNEALGVTQAIHDLNRDGTVNDLDVQIVANAVLTGVCQTPPTTGTLTINASGVGGTVNVSGESPCLGGAETNSCIYKFPLKTEVTITPVPHNGYSAQTSGVCGTVTISTVPQGCAVKFRPSDVPPPMGTLIVSVEYIGGSVLVSGRGSCAAGAGGAAHSCTYQFPVGTAVNINPVPLNPFYFPQTFGNCGRVIIASTTQSCGVEFFSTAVP
jgi:hypothetical protein